MDFMYFTVLLLAFLIPGVLSDTCQTKSATTINCEYGCCGNECWELNNIVLYTGCSAGGIILIITAIICVYACAKTSFKASLILSPSSIAKKMDLPPDYSPIPPEGHFKCYSIAPVPPSYTARKVPPPPYSG